MKKKVESMAVLVFLVLALCAAAFARGRAAQDGQHPVMDALANKIVQKYESSSCDQLVMQRSQSHVQPKSPAEQRAIAMLRADPQMRAEFIDKIAAPIANKLFDCNMIP
jgi:hypothetical protein